MEVSFTVDKAAVYGEVGRTTEYAAAKMEGDPESNLRRVYASPADWELLDRFWEESRATLAHSVREFFSRDVEEGGSYRLWLRVQPRFKASLSEGMGRALHCYFASSVTAKWFMVADKADAEGYSLVAKSHLDDFCRKLYWKDPPARPGSLKEG